MHHPLPARQRRASTLTAAVVGLLLAGCASTSAPVAYEASSSPAKSARFDTDLRTCRDRAVQSVGVNGIKGPQLVQASARKGGTAFVKEAVDRFVSGSGSVLKRARGAGAGEAAGTVTSVLLNWNEPDSVHRQYVDRCLKDRGHTVLGWR